MPTPQLQNPAQAFGVTSLGGYTGDDRWPLVETMRASVTTILRGDIVALSTSSGYVIRCLTNTSPQIMVGIACEAPAAVGQEIMVMVYGPFYGANKDNTVAVTAADILGRSAAVTGSLLSLTAGLVVTTYAGLLQGIGIAMASQTAGDTTVDIFVCKV